MAEASRMKVISTENVSSKIIMDAVGADLDHLRSATEYGTEPLGPGTVIATDGSTSPCTLRVDHGSEHLTRRASRMRWGMSIRVAVCGAFLLGWTSVGHSTPSAKTLTKKSKEHLAAGCQKGDRVYCVALAAKELAATPDDAAVLARAFKAYYGACTANVMEGCGYLGELYQFGLGVEIDFAKAARLFEKGCNGKDPLGCSDLGVLYEFGQGVPKNEAKAVGLYQQGCDGGLMIACVNLGFMHSRGTGTSVALDKAYALYEKACTNEEAKGCVNLGSVHMRGNAKIARNRVTAIKYYEKACKFGDGPSCAWLEKQN